MKYYRRPNGQFGKPTIYELFGVPESALADCAYKCERCGRVFFPILKSSKCACGSDDKIALPRR